MDLEDEGGDVNQASRMVREIFETEYMRGLGKEPKFVQLESKLYKLFQHLYTHSYSWRDA